MAEQIFKACNTCPPGKYCKTHCLCYRCPLKDDCDGIHECKFDEKMGLK